MKKVQPIKGFKVMDWLRDVREKRYKLYKENPEEYYRQVRIAGEGFKKLIITEKALYNERKNL